MSQPRSHPSRSSDVTRFCLAFWRQEDGASLIEYILLVALIAVVALGAITLLGSNANTKLGTAANALQ